MDRRDFLKSATGAVGAAAAAKMMTVRAQAASESTDTTGMMYRTLGRTGERVSAIGLGGYHIGKPSLSEQDSIQLIRQAVDFCQHIRFVHGCEPGRIIQIHGHSSD